MTRRKFTEREVVAIVARQKQCEACGQIYARGRYTDARWAAQRFCSIKCAATRRPKKRPLSDRLWSYVAKGEPDECWEWTGNRTPLGYGRIHVDGTVNLAHRVVYQSVNGSIPDGLLVCHSCDNPSCCNPNHLWVGTHKDNTDDMVRKGRSKLFGDSK